MATLFVWFFFFRILERHGVRTEALQQALHQALQRGCALGLCHPENNWYQSSSGNSNAAPHSRHRGKPYKNELRFYYVLPGTIPNEVNSLCLQRLPGFPLWWKSKFRPKNRPTRGFLSSFCPVMDISIHHSIVVCHLMYLEYVSWLWQFLKYMPYSICVKPKARFLWPAGA